MIFLTGGELFGQAQSHESLFGKKNVIDSAVLFPFTEKSAPGPGQKLDAKLIAKEIIMSIVDRKFLGLDQEEEEESLD